MSCAPSARACPSSRGGSVGGRRGVARAGGCRCRSPVPPPLLRPERYSSLPRHRRPNGGMGLIIDQREIVEGEIEDGPHRRIDLHARRGGRGAAGGRRGRGGGGGGGGGGAQRGRGGAGPRAGGRREQRRGRRGRGD